jgi:hypothetical protein
MHLFNCPCCGKLGISWDQRSGHFLCRSLGCTASFPPPDPHEFGYAGDIGNALLVGRIAAQSVQDWLTAQGPKIQRTSATAC